MRRRGPAKKSLSTVILIFTAAPFVLFGRPGGSPQSQPSEAERLAGLLASSLEYCERVKTIALYFVCREDIKDIENIFGKISGSNTIIRDEKIFTIRRVKRRTYCYDYQLIRKAEDFIEKRILLEENGRKKHVGNADLSQLKYSCQYPLFGPVGFLSRYWQDRFTFSIVGEENLSGEPAVVIQAIPSEFREENFNIGRIWINRASQILRIEWEPDSIQNYADETIATPRGEFHKTVRWRVDYSVEHKGIRFPGRQVIQEIFYRDSPSGVRQQAVKRETVFEYRDFKFFVVDTNVDIRSKTP